MPAYKSQQDSALGSEREQTPSINLWDVTVSEVVAVLKHLLHQLHIMAE